MKTKRLFKYLISIQAIGFLVAILIVWTDELFDIPHRLFGAPATPVRWSECLYESVAITLLGIFCVAFTCYLFKRIRELESFLSMCAWCKKIHYNDSWIPIEQYLAARHEQETSHGICPQCLEEVRGKFKKK
ncbi:MAG: hypothetical protein WCG27_03930 [Pseudomonadota bacterium]